MEALIAAAAAAAAALLMLVFLVVRAVRDAPDRAELARLRTRDQDFQDALAQIREKDSRLGELQVENARLAAALENEKRAASEKLSLLQDAEARLKTEFENLANRIFEEKGRALTDQNRERLAGLLQPFKEQLEAFRRRVDEVHRNDIERTASLVEQVRQLQETSSRVSEEANNLARAIKGDAKRQGDWGELIVERIFEASGLVRDRDYQTQQVFYGEDGGLRRPDFIVQLPGDRAVIVDAKVSLTAYERFSSAEDEPGRNAALAEHVRSVRRHVEELRAKDYDRLLGNKTLDFVLMCIPLEPAFQAALQADESLLYDLARTNVVVAGPATLMITLKLVAQLWRREYENRNAEIIADRAGRLYDQVCLIADAMSDAQRKLDGVAQSFELAMNRLRGGRGNLVGRVEELRRLGAKSSKQLPAEAVDESLPADFEAPPEDSPAE